MNTIERIGMALRQVKLPKGCFFFDVDGMKVFPMYGVTGSLTTRSVIYVIKRGTTPAPENVSMPLQGTAELGDGWMALAIQVFPGDSIDPSVIQAKIDAHLQELA